MNKLSPETIEKLEWLKGRLRKYPHRYNQGTFCGTQACLAGFCLPKVVNKRRVVIGSEDFGAFKGNYAFGDMAAKWLGIDLAQRLLLFRCVWAGKAYFFNRRLGDTDEQAAEKACQRIDLFIQSGGTQ